MDNSKFPGSSKSKVNRAGDHIRLGQLTDEDVAVLETWRSAHRGVLNTFQAILRNRTRGHPITVAQRHKRRSTIVDKLFRYPKMQLVRIDDIAGCRLIFDNEESLYKFRSDFHQAQFKHRRINDVDKYDYIKRLKKDSGYRGIHDVYEYDVRSKVGESLAGLLVEIQYRTLVQHAWATAVELVGFLTESQPKFKKGDTRYEQAMALASEILARSAEQRAGPFPEMSNDALVKEFAHLDSELGLMKLLRGLHAADRPADAAVSSRRNTINIDICSE